MRSRQSTRAAAQNRSDAGPAQHLVWDHWSSRITRGAWLRGSSGKAGDQLAPGFELDGRAREVVAHRFGAAAKMFGEKQLEHGVERAAIFCTPEAVAFVGIVHVGH